MDKTASNVGSLGLGLAEETLVLAAGDSLSHGNSDQFAEMVRERLSDGCGSVFLDLGEVETVDSSGLRALLGIRKWCEDHGARLRLGAVSDCVARVLTISHVNELFGIAERIVTERPTGLLPRIETAGEPRRTHEYRAVSDASVIAGLREKAVDAAIEAGASPEAVCDIRIAVGEALTNAYKHGSPRKGIDEIYLRCVSCPGAIVFEIQDEGRPFDPDGLDEPDPNMMRDHGMGIYLMREAMDVVEFTCDCPGNRVRMIRWLSRG